MLRAPSFLLAVVGLSAGLAFGQTAADPLDACSAEKDDAARLACFDRQMALRHRHAGAQLGATAQPTSPHPAAQQPQAQPAGPPPQVTQSHGQTAVSPPQVTQSLGRTVVPPPPQGAGASPPPAPDANYGLHAKARALPPVSATVARLVRVSATEYAFQLDNGQIWQQTDSRPGLSVRVNDRVTINPGIFGDFFFTTADRQRIRVKRIR